MGDISKTTGPEGPVKMTGSREKRLPGDKEAFQKKMEKVDEADPEQKKKRRQREEEAEEAKETIKEAHKQTTRKDRVKPFEVRKSMSAKASLSKGSPTAPKKTTGAPPPAIEGADTESLFFDEDDLDIAPVSGISEQIVAKELTPHEQAALKKPEPAEGKEVKEAKPAAPKAPEELAPALPEEEIPKVEEESVAGQPPEKPEKKEAKKDEAVPLAAKEEVAALAPPPSLATESIAPPSPTAMPTYATLSPEMVELFDRMVGVMTVITTSGVTETTLSLDAPQFASSMFFGAEITIREYSTAPKAFNIELKGNVQTVAQFQANIPSLEQAFKAGNYKFSVNRIETSLRRIPESPVKDKDQEEKEREGEE